MSQERHEILTHSFKHVESYQQWRHVKINVKVPENS